MRTKTEIDISTAIVRGSIATLVAQAPLLVVDVSQSGCLLETQQPLEAGRVGTLRLALNGGWYIEDVRITRCSAVSGRGSTYHVGVEFLRTRRLPDQSLRRAVGEIIGGAARPDPEVKWTIRQNKERK